MKCKLLCSLILESVALKKSQTFIVHIAGSNMDIIMDGSLAAKASDNLQLDPKVGMLFNSEDEAYNFYNYYAKRKGFSVRKGHISRRKDGTIKLRHFLCSNEGTRKQHCKHVTKKPRAIQRTNCMARIEYKVSRDNIWVVSKHIDEHNHPLTSATQSQLLRSHRKKMPAKRGLIDETDNVADEMDGIGVISAQAYNFLQKEFHERESVGFPLNNPSNNILPTMRMRDFEQGDAQFLLDYLKAKQVEDPSFFYAIQLDEKERSTNFFWADARSIIDYVYFGDVISFDTTYRTNVYDIPFAPFIGINHHKQVVVFGAALLLDETTESFIWLFRTFMAAMSGRQPKTIFTDHCAAISEAVAMTLTETCHRYCSWHILQNATQLLSHMYTSETGFQQEFKDCIYECGSEDDFHNGWNNLITKYDLASNLWLEDLYAVREKWALVYHINSFCAIMTTTEWSESMDIHFKTYFYRKLSPLKFMIHYHKALFQLRERELLEDIKSRRAKSVPLVDVPMLKMGAESYTRVIYKFFEEEYKSQLACLCEPVGMDGTMHTFRVYLTQKRCHGLVEFNSSDVAVTCSCKKFESTGILCMHALKVLNNNNILHLPSQYILKRWTKYAKHGLSSDRQKSRFESDGQELLPLCYNRVLRKAVFIAVKGAVSKEALELVECRLDKFMLEMGKCAT